MANDRQRSRSGSYGVADEDIPEMTTTDFRRAKRVAEFMPELIHAAKRARGRPRIATPKAHVSLRLDPEIIAAFKAEGPGWQRRINAVLARAVSNKKSRGTSKKKSRARSRR